MISNLYVQKYVFSNRCKKHIFIRFLCVVLFSLVRCSVLRKRDFVFRSSSRRRGLRGLQPQATGDRLRAESLLPEPGQAVVASEPRRTLAPVLQIRRSTGKDSSNQCLTLFFNSFVKSLKHLVIKLLLHKC